MGKSSRVKGRASVAAARRSSGAFMWYAIAGVIVLVGVVLVAMSAGGSDQAEPIANRDHWHAAIGVNMCGDWEPNPPEFEQRAGTALTAGIHSHGDGLMHIHPFSSDEAGRRATVGRFFEFGGWDVSESSMRLWTGETKSNGDTCGDEPATVRWSVNGEERSGDPGDYHPEDGDVIAIAFLPEGDEIGRPPSAANLASPSDLSGGATPPPSDTTPTSAPTGSTPTSAATDTTAGASPTSGPSATTVP